jgi:hypothetical protein
MVKIRAQKPSVNIKMGSIYKYRVFCETENAYVYGWNTVAQTTCFNNNSHTINQSITSIVDIITSEIPLNSSNQVLTNIPITDSNQVLTNIPITDLDEVRIAGRVLNFPLSAFNEIRVVERTRIIELKSMFGKSTLRDRYLEQGTGQIKNSAGDPEYTLSVSGSNDIAQLRSAERTRYVAGFSGEVGIAVRIPQTLSGNQTLKWGVFDELNGFYFKYTASGFNVVILRDGIENVIPRAEWNNDKLDGTGPSKLTLNETYGIIFIIEFSWYGYGNVSFKININSPSLGQNSFIVHVYSVTTQTSVKNPNLPISVELANNGTVSSKQAFVAGRQYSIIGKYEPIVRMNSTYVIDASVTLSPRPIMSLRRKIGFLGNPVSSLQADFIASTDQIIQVIVNVGLTGSVFISPSDIPSVDTAVERDIVATAYTGGNIIWTGFITGDNRTAAINSLNLKYVFTEYDIVTIVSRGISSTNGKLSVVARWTEEW